MRCYDLKDNMRVKWLNVFLVLAILCFSSISVSAVGWGSSKIYEIDMDYLQRNEPGVIGGYNAEYGASCRLFGYIVFNLVDDEGCYGDSNYWKYRMDVTLYSYCEERNELLVRDGEDMFFFPFLTHHSIDIPNSFSMMGKSWQADTKLGVECPDEYGCILDESGAEPYVCFSPTLWETATSDEKNLKFSMAAIAPTPYVYQGASQYGLSARDMPSKLLVDTYPPVKLLMGEEGRTDMYYYTSNMGALPTDVDRRDDNLPDYSFEDYTYMQRAPGYSGYSYSTECTLDGDITFDLIIDTQCPQMSGSLEDPSNLDLYYTTVDLTSTCTDANVLNVADDTYTNFWVYMTEYGTGYGQYLPSLLSQANSIEGRMRAHIDCVPDEDTVVRTCTIKTPALNYGTHFYSNGANTNGVCFDETLWVIADDDERLLKASFPLPFHDGNLQSYISNDGLMQEPPAEVESVYVAGIDWANPRWVHYFSTAEQDASTTTTTTIPCHCNKKDVEICFNVIDYDTSVGLSSINVVLTQSPSYGTFSCTTTNGECCIEHYDDTKYSEFKVVDSLDRYDYFKLPLGNSVPMYLFNMTMLAPLEEDGQVYTIKLKKKDSFYCRSDIYGYRAVCYYDRKRYDIYDTRNTFTITKTNADDYEYNPISVIPNEGTDDMRGLLVLNPIYCDDGLFSSVEKHNPFDIYRIAEDCGVNSDICMWEGNDDITDEDVSTQQDRVVCLKTYSGTHYSDEKYFRSLLPTAPTFVSYGTKVSYQSFGDSYNAPVFSQKQCYKDSDCLQFGSESKCNAATNKCGSGSGPGGLFPIEPYSYFDDDQPGMIIKWDTPVICKTEDSYQCDVYLPSELKYRIYRMFDSDSYWTEITNCGSAGCSMYDSQSDINAYDDKFHDISGCDGLHPEICGAALVGKTVKYGIWVYALENGVNTNVERSEVTEATFDECVQDGDPDDWLECSSLQCSNTLGYCVSENCVDKSCTTDADCNDCFTDAYGYRSTTFCYLPTHVCKPEYKHCDEDSDCTGGTANGIWKDPLVDKFCDLKLRVLIATDDWVRRGANYNLDWAGVFASSVCVNKNDDGNKCTSNSECDSGNCVGGGLASVPTACKFPEYRVKDDIFKIHSEYAVDDCYSSTGGYGRKGFCYGDEYADLKYIYDTFADNGQCYKLGTCQSVTVVSCEGGISGDDDCRNELDDPDAYCDDRYKNAYCVSGTQRSLCGDYCLRDSWCNADTQYIVCDLSPDETSGTCLPPGGGQCVTTTTTLPTQQCDYKKCKQDSAFVAKNDGGTVVTCIDGQGCPVKVGGVYQKYADGTWKYDGCGCGEGYACFENHANPGTGLCYELLNTHQPCDYYPFGVNAAGPDALCKSFNCMGDSFSSVARPTCQQRTTQCVYNALKTDSNDDLRDPEMYCHCEPDQLGVSIGGIDDDKEPCSQIYDVSLVTAQGNVKNNYKWCFAEDVAFGSPHGDTYPNFKCYIKLSDGSSCSESYQCVSQECINNVCSTSSNNKGLGDVCIVKNVDNNKDMIWNVRDNNEFSVTYWLDDCSDDTDDGELYCEPCNFDLGKLYSKNSQTCSSASVKIGMTGRCAKAKITEGAWCYSNSQCESSLISEGTGYKSLNCGVTDEYPASCDSSNDYCTSGNSLSFNRHCVYEEVGKCYHDAASPLDIFRMKVDDRCYTMQYIVGDLTSTDDMFCDDEHLCTNINTGETADCEFFTGTDRLQATHILGKCVVDHCPVEDEVYLSSDCMRAPGFDEHHVAFAGSELDNSLVYCDGPVGICKWRKDKDISCPSGSNDECMPGLKCVNHVCKEKNCIDSGDCEENEECVIGKCISKTSYWVTITATNGLSKKSNSPFGSSYDFVVSCDKEDYTFKYSSQASIQLKYEINSGSGFGSPAWFGDSKNIVATELTASIKELCTKEMVMNTASLPYRIVDINFIPVLSGNLDYSIKVTKRVLVLSRSLSVDPIRYNPNMVETLFDFPEVNSNTYIILQNNTDIRSISCSGSSTADGLYEVYLYPRVSENDFPNFNYARVVDWTDTKYYRCEDQYGTFVEGTLLVNPAEWLFNIRFTPYQQLLLIIIVLLGIPTFVLASTRKR